MGSTSRSSSSRVAEIRADLARTAYAHAHGITIDDLDPVGDKAGVDELDEVLDRVFIDHGIIDFDRHFPHEHKSDSSSPFPLCTFTAPTGEMCQEPLP